MVMRARTGTGWNASGALTTAPYHTRPMDLLLFEIKSLWQMPPCDDV